MPKKALDEHVAEWLRLVESVTRNLVELEHLRVDLETLDKSVGDILALKQRQLALRAAAQQATRDLDASMAVATEAAVKLRHGIVAKYTTRSEKLREFSLRPRRGPGPRNQATPAAAEEPAPAPKPRRRRK
ncbi:MAG TPA: hypothetical protein VK899_06140 [Gemmatimonadales bacterium]|nr:hypothetical protein [Gemmatimonadales bacterium]